MKMIFPRLKLIDGSATVQLLPHYSLLFPNQAFSMYDRTVTVIVHISHSKYTTRSSCLKNCCFFIKG